MRKITKRFQHLHQKIKIYNKPKIFGVGANKTGTTSLTVAMQDLGFTVGKERWAKNYIAEWANRDFKKIIRFCHSAEFFQDEPFSLPYTFIAVDQAFPKSKFILTLRDSPEQWYYSNINHMSRKLGLNGRLPTREDQQNAKLSKIGSFWEKTSLIRSVDEEDIYNKDQVIERYLNHNKSVMEYFRNRQDDLLVLNVAEPNAHKKLCDFLGIKTERNNFKWKNKAPNK